VREFHNSEGRVQTELALELLDVPFVRHSSSQIDPSKVGKPLASQNTADMVIKEVAFILEYELRAWAQCHHLNLVEVWRGVRSTASILAQAKVMTMAYCFTPGEGASAPHEILRGPSFDLTFARELAAHFPSKSEGKVHGTGFITEGSVSIRGFAHVLGRVCRRACAQVDVYRSFVDLGSGLGNPVIAAHALFPFRHCVGIEIQRQFIEISRSRANKYANRLRNDISYQKPLSIFDPKDLFIHGDFLTDVDWSNASVVVCNAVTWPPDLIEAISKLALRLRRGAIFMLMGFGKFLPVTSTMLRSFDFHGEACLVGWLSDTAQGFWVFQRV